MKKSISITIVSFTCALMFVAFQNMTPPKTSNAIGLAKCNTPYDNLMTAESGQVPSEFVFSPNVVSLKYPPMGNGVTAFVNQRTVEDQQRFGAGNMDMNWVFIPSLGSYGWVDRYCVPSTSYGHQGAGTWALLYIWYPDGGRWEYWTSGKVNAR